MSLDQGTAVQRAAIIRKGSISYSFSIILQPKGYLGIAEIIFIIDNTNFTSLPIDFSGTTTSIVVNSIQNPGIQATKNFLLIPKQYLQKGRNIISIQYENSYDTDKLGCVTFNDDTGKQYVYTQFQPYAANRVFPCFDQPNLKATMELSIIAPAQWKVVSNQPLLISFKFDNSQFKKLCNGTNIQSNRLKNTLIQKVGTDTKMTQFKKTSLLPAYILGFAAGPFYRIQSGSGSVPMSLYTLESSRSTFEEYSKFIFEITQKTMAFFEQLFGIQYPFEKYDQVWVRECWFSAMQNAGVVTFDQSILKSAKPLAPSQEELLYLAEIIAHQLSHHWFGNLVTMQWWDDLWLNQSFADFISIYAVQKINNQLEQPFQIPAIFSRYSKTKGYKYDERNNSTHPIRSEVLDTDVAMNIFDGISYNKGAAAIKQLWFLIGQKNFSAALNSYFSRFKFSNATIHDLFDDLRPYFPTFVTADNWRSTWLETPSLNVFEVIWDPSKISSSQTLSLYQSPYTQTYSVLRFHAFQIALFDKNGDFIIKTVKIDPSTSKTDIAYDGSTMISAVLVNYNDHTFIQNYIDPVSLQFFKTNISKIKDDLARALVWFNMSAMVRQGLVRADQFATIVEVHLLSNEQINFVLDKILDQLRNHIQEYLDNQTKITLKRSIFFQINSLLSDPSLTQDRKRILQRHLIQYAQQERDVVQLTQLVSELIPKQYNWEIVKKIFTLPSYPQSLKQQWFNQVLSIDSSYLSEEARIVCNAIAASPTSFTQIYQNLKSPGGIDIRTRQLITEGIRHNTQYQAIFDIYAEQYFKDLVDPNIYQRLSYSEYQIFYQGLRPITTNYADLINNYKKAINQLSSLPTMIAHCLNFQKIIDDLSLIDKNSTFNFDSNLTLTQIRATQRSNYIIKESISYICHISYASLSSSQSYAGLTEITFSLAYIPQILPLDCVAFQISDLVVNGYNVSSVDNGQFLLIPRIYLKLGVNKIQVNYLNYYNNDGLGCMAYVDATVSPAQEYTYTKFQPAGAHRYFPCFDQPNLKAKAKFNVIIPSNWTAVGNYAIAFQGSFTQADYIANASYQNLGLLNKFLSGKAGDFYVFNQTDLLPTYLYCIIAGQYYSVVASPAQVYRGIPMTIYCLKSYKPNLDLYANFIFQSTTLSLSLYETKFGVNYQFPKYDSVFCHEFKSGAMQNVGVITFNDSYLYGEQVSVDKLASLAVVIAHECSHNWFGNYVTMQWWNDLWLNQSFADFISYYCVDIIRTQIPQLADLPTGWLGGLVRSVGGYRQDQMFTTHPVRSQVPNVGVASAIFDSITYRKGSMTLKQLMFLMSEVNFFRGLHDYFVSFGWKNATIDDFLGCMSRYFYFPQFTLNDWKQMWILTPSLNVITVEWDDTKTSVAQTLTIVQKDFDPSLQLFRYHSVNVAFFKADGSYKTQKVLIKNTANTVITYDASSGIKAILVNQGHQDFMKYRFDSVSRDFFIANVNTISDPLTRMIIYFYLNQEVRDGLEKVLPYKNDILQVIGDEPQDSVFDFVLKFLNQATGSYIPISQRPLVRTDLFSFVLSSLTNLGKKLQKSASLDFSPKDRRKKHSQNYKQAPVLSSTQNRIIILKDLLPIFCSNSSETDILKQWLQNKYQPLLNFPITVSQGWAVVKLIYASSSYTLDVKNAAYSRQNAKYPGITAELANNTCLMLVADNLVMQSTYSTFKTMDESLTVKASLAEGWNSLVHRTILFNNYKPRYFSDLPLMSLQLNSNHFQFFYTNLKPIDDDLLKTIEQFKAINLKGSAMIGHMKSINKILDNYQLRSMLYRVNSLIKQ